ncbi:10538_t:CDS:1, partial [Scutellospora calospora]
MNKLRKKRMILSIKTKQEICQCKQKNSFISIDQLSEEYSCDRSTISKIWKESEKWLSMQLADVEENKIVNYPAKFVELETALYTWMRRILSRNGMVTDGILQIQAKKFAELLDI